MARGYIRIKPFGGLFFGKGRPFNMGDETWTEAELLPPPGVVWGALFSQLWYRDNHTPLESLKIGKIMVMGENVTQLYLPAPLDIFSSGENRYHHKFYWQDKEDFLHWNSDKNVLLKPETEEDVESPEQELLSASSLKAYAGADKIFDVKTSHLNNLVKGEFKIGIARSEETRVVKESLLYTVNLAHLGEEHAFLVEAEYSSNFPEEGIMKMGGEGKLVHFKVIEESSELGQSLKTALSLPEPEDQVGFFKLYLTAPAPLNAGGIPRFLEDKPFSVEAGVTGKPQLFGGFDLDLRRPKPKELLAPAGSVYILEYRGDSGRCTVGEAKKSLRNSINSNELDQKELLQDNVYGNGLNQFEIFPYYG